MHAKIGKSFSRLQEDILVNYPLTLLINPRLHPLMQKIAALLIIFTCLAISVKCQKYLILERPGTTKHHIFKTGNRIRLYDVQSMRVIQGNISRINDTMIVINSVVPVRLRNITAVYRPLTMLHLFSRTATAAGTGYLLLTVLNKGINKNSPAVNNGTFIVSGTIIFTGVATSFLRYRKFPIGRKWRVKIIDLTNPSQ